MGRRRTVIHAAYWLDGQPERRISTEILNPDNGKPFAISEARLDHAVFYANEMRDMMPMAELRRERQLRADVIYSRFEQLARDAIEQMEKDEGWDIWLDRLGRGNSNDR